MRKSGARKSYDSSSALLHNIMQHDAIAYNAGNSSRLCCSRAAARLSINEREGVRLCDPQFTADSSQAPACTSWSAMNGDSRRLPRVVCGPRPVMIWVAEPVAIDDMAEGCSPGEGSHGVGGGRGPHLCSSLD